MTWNELLGFFVACTNRDELYAGSAACCL